jgi:hypothetical protein
VRPASTNGPTSRRRPHGTGGKPRRWGSRPGRLGVFTVIAAALLGALITVLTSSEPGTALGVFLLAGTAAGVTVVRAHSAYLIIPVPAPAYLLAATIAGLIHDRAVDTSRAALALSAVQWAADGFLVMLAATILATVIALTRRIVGNRDMSPEARDHLGWAAPPPSHRRDRAPQ